MPAQKTTKSAAPAAQPEKVKKASSVPAKKTKDTEVLDDSASTKKKTTRATKPAAAEAAPEPKAAAKAPAAKRGRKPKADAKAAPAAEEDLDLSDIEADLALEEEPAPAAAEGGTVEKVKRLRMKISKAKERALRKEFGLDETILTEEELVKRRARLKTLIT